MAVPQNHTITFRHYEYHSAASVYVSGGAEDVRGMLMTLDPPIKISAERIVLSYQTKAFSVEMIDERTWRISSGDKPLVRQVANHIGRHKNARRINTNRPTQSVFSTTDLVLITFLSLFTLLMVGLCFGSIDDMRLDLAKEARMLEGRITNISSSHGKNIRNRSTRFLDFTLDGNHVFRFAPKENYDLLLQEMKTGEQVRIYQSRYGDDIYQIEKGKRILYNKSNVEKGQIPLLVMTIIFGALSTGATLFCIRQPFQRKKFRTS